ncbi:ABC transporter substrate binding protein [Desulfococcaceae bacterium HSG8]|nr:ABC transporter substrate binding protein [Desulfococcaceae bacterium HSG8]
MKVFFRITLINLVFILFLSFSVGFAANKKEYPTSPPAKIAKKWRIGYLEGGPYVSYQQYLAEISKALSDLGWIEPITIPPRENESETDKLWAWLAANAKSNYLEFAVNAHYSNNWNKKGREENKKTVLRRLNETRDIDLMIAMGTWAGQDLANNDHSVPVLVCSTSDPIAAKIIKNEKDSGYDHVHARVDPARFERQIRAFHDVIGFSKLGMAFRDTVDGRSIAGMEAVRKVAGERNFEVLECHTSSGISEEAVARMVECTRELAPKADAFYIVEQSAVTLKTLPRILEVLNAHKTPAFSQSGADHVRHGVLLNVSNTSYKEVGRFHAETVAQIINGAKPRNLPQIYEPPVKIAFNKVAAKLIDLNDDIYQLLSETADEVYEKIEVSK